MEFEYDRLNQPPVVYKPHPVIERLKQAETLHVSKKTPSTSEDSCQEEKKDSFEIESTKIFTNIVDKLDIYYQEKMKIEVKIR